MIFIVSTCGDIPKEELIELQKRLEAEANSPNKNKVMCLPRFATIASIDERSKLNEIYRLGIIYYEICLLYCWGDFS